MISHKQGMILGLEYDLQKDACGVDDLADRWARYMHWDIVYT